MTRIRGWSHRYRVSAVVVVALLLALVLTMTGRALASQGDDRYRVAAATTDDVTETLTTSGTVDATQRSDVATVVDGVVEQVPVRTGDIVQAGDLLVSLVQDDAQRAVRQAEATLAQARADLESAEGSQSSAVQQATSSAPTGNGGGSSATAGPNSGSGSALPPVALPTLDELTALQEAVKTAQTASTSALASAAAALETQTLSCADAYGRGAAAEDGSPASDEANAACDAALVAVQEAQALASDRQNELQVAIDALTQGLAAATDQTSTAVGVLQGWIDQNRSVASVEPSDGSAAPSGSTAGSATAPSSNGVAGQSALSLASAQAAVDSAEATLLGANADLQATQIVARTSGTVSTVEVSAGDSVTQGDLLVVVIGDGGATVTLSVDATSARVLSVDQVAQVTIPGSTRTSDGEVVWISPVSSSTDSGFPGQAGTYAVEVHVPSSELADGPLPQGARAGVTIVVGTSEGVTTVPTSAVTLNATGGAIEVLTADGTIEQRTVELGRIGTARTEVVSGVEVDDKVVLADLDAEIDAAGEVNTDAEAGFPGGGPPGGAGSAPPAGFTGPPGR